MNNLFRLKYFYSVLILLLHACNVMLLDIIHYAVRFPPGVSVGHNLLIIHGMEVHGSNVSADHQLPHDLTKRTIPESDLLARSVKLKRAHKFDDSLEFMTWQYLSDKTWNKEIPVAMDINLYPVYDMGYTGKGVRVSVVDDALDITHDDLKDNYDPEISINLNSPRKYGFSPRGTLGKMKDDNMHGTMCAGIIAGSANNKKCSHGVAYNSKVGCVRMLNDKVTDILEARSVSYKLNLVDIYTTSWGPTDNGELMQPIGKDLKRQFRHGVIKGRGEKGVLYVIASGNGGYSEDSCGADGFLNDPNIIGVSALTETGKKPKYAESCSAIRISVPIGSVNLKHRKDILATTTANNKCDKKFVGTSAACPMLAGVLALSLEANQNLTTRDVMHVLTMSGRIQSLDINPNDYAVNGAGLLYSPHFGSGLVDSKKLVVISEMWNNVGLYCKISESYGVKKEFKWYSKMMKKQSRSSYKLSPLRKNIENDTEGMKLLFNETLTIPFNIRLNMEGKPVYANPNTTDACTVEIAETISLDLWWAHQCRGSMKVVLQSPMGTQSELLFPRRYDKHVGPNYMRFSSVHFYGEKVVGEWKLMLTDTLPKCIGYSGHVRGRVYGAKLILRGTTVIESAAHLNPEVYDRFLTPLGGEARDQGKAMKFNKKQFQEAYNHQLQAYYNNQTLSE